MKVITLKKKNADNCITFKKSKKILPEESFDETLAKCLEILESISQRTETCNFSNEPPLGTEKNGKIKISMSPEIWKDKKKLDGKFLKVGGIVIFKNDYDKLVTGKVLSIENSEIKVLTKHGAKRIKPNSIKRCFSTFERFCKEIANTSVPMGEKITRIYSVSELMSQNELADYMIPEDISIVTGVNSDGVLQINWPERDGYDGKNIKRFNPKGKKISRVGNDKGKSTTLKLQSTYSDRAIPYITNPYSEKVGFLTSSYKRVLNLLRLGKYSELCKTLPNPLTMEEFEKMRTKYLKYLDRSKNQLGVDSPFYGIIGKAAPWSPYEGNASQLNLPLPVEDLKKLNIIVLEPKN